MSVEFRIEAQIINVALTRFAQHVCVIVYTEFAIDGIGDWEFAAP